MRPAGIGKGSFYAFFDSKESLYLEVMLRRAPRVGSGLAAPLSRPVDEDGLVWALEQRLIAGAALDVFEEEPTIHPGLFALENVLLAPHIGSATVETRTAMADLAVSNALAVLAGRPPLTPVG